MSYILDALRKSEQQRQATQPDTVTDRILVNPPQPKQKSAKWIAALVISNLLVIAYFVWFFTQKASLELQHKNQVAGQPAKQLLSPSLTSQAKVTGKAEPSLPRETGQEVSSPTISQMIETQKISDIPRPKKRILDKQPLAAIKNSTPRLSAPTIPSQPADIAPEKPEIPPSKKGAVALDELPYEIRNTLPNLSINVFSYAHQPEDRFVIIDMVKYRTGQLIKGSVKLNEIRPDSIVLQYGNNTFKIDRP